MTPEPEFETNEKTWFEATFSFKNPAGGLVVPTTVRWKLWNVTAAVEKQAWTTLTPASQIVLNVSGQLLTIANTANDVELYQLIANADAGLASEQLKELYFNVKNVANA